MIIRRCPKEVKTIHDEMCDPHKRAFTCFHAICPRPAHLAQSCPCLRLLCLTATSRLFMFECAKRGINTGVYIRQAIFAAAGGVSGKFVQQANVRVACCKG